MYTYFDIAQVWTVDYMPEVIVTKYTNTQIIMNSSKLRQFYKFISLRLLHRSLHFVPERCTYDKLLKIKLHSTLNLSTSTLLNSDSKMTSETSLNVDYNELLKAQNNSSILIIDVREKSEIDETGKLPGSVHIPVGEISSTFSTLSENDFKEKFKKEKPTKDTKIILSCRSGKRSSMAQEEMQKLGYKNAYNYVGGWLDWESKQKV